MASTGYQAGEGWAKWHSPAIVARQPRPEAPPAWVLRGSSAACRQLRSQVERIAPHYRTALLRGEPGSGKQLVGRALHAFSSAASSPFFVVSAQTLLERTQNAAVAPAPVSPAIASAVDWLIESASDGTVYLTGCVTLSLREQAILNDVLTAADERRAPFRLQVPSERDLGTLCSIGHLRPELYARLAAIEIAVPSLEQRCEDIAVLSAGVLSWFAEQMSGERAKTLSPDSLHVLERSAWPRTLRGLQRALTQAAALAEGPVIESWHLTGASAAAPQTAERASRLEGVSRPDRIDRLDDVIRHHVLDVMSRCGGNKLRAAGLLGISRSTLYRMLESSGQVPAEI